jgi:hypothetical protein
MASRVWIPADAAALALGAKATPRAEKGSSGASFS